MASCLSLETYRVLKKVSLTPVDIQLVATIREDTRISGRSDRGIPADGPATRVGAHCGRNTGDASGRLECITTGRNGLAGSRSGNGHGGEPGHDGEQPQVLDDSHCGFDGRVFNVRSVSGMYISKL